MPWERGLGYNWHFEMELRDMHECGGEASAVTMSDEGKRGMGETSVGYDTAMTAPVGTSQNPSHEILTPANVITFCRLLLTICFFFLYTMGEEQLRGVALGCYAIAAATDFLDGQVARRTQTVSWLGKVMDPLMDRVLLFLGVAGLLLSGELPLWVALFVVLRDAILAAGVMWLRCYQDRPMDVIYVGKAATALLMTGFVDLLIGAPVLAGLGITDASWLPGLNATPAPVGMLLVYVGVVLSTIAAIVYYQKGLAIRKRVRAERLGH